MYMYFCSVYVRALDVYRNLYDKGSVYYGVKETPRVYRY